MYHFIIKFSQSHQAFDVTSQLSFIQIGRRRNAVLAKAATVITNPSEWSTTRLSLHPSKKPRRRVQYPTKRSNVHDVNGYVKSLEALYLISP